MKEETPVLTQPPVEPAEQATNAAESKPAEREKRPPEPGDERGSRAGWPGIVALLALVGVVLVGWQVFELRKGTGDVRQELAQRLSGGEATVSELRGLTRQQQETIASLQGKLGALESQVAASEGQAVALESLYHEFSRTREDRVVAEVEQAVSVAAQQLQLAGNIEAAVIALQGAEARLAAHDRGQLQAVRRAIARDLEQLKALPQLDVPGVARRLEALLERADALPLAFAGELAKTAEGSGGAEDAAAASQAGAPAAEVSPMNFLADLARDVWREVKTLVRIERLDQAEMPVLLAPAQSTFLRENLKIRLLTARLALLARDGRTYAADLAQSRAWIERFFDVKDPAVRAVVTELESLEAIPVKVQQVSPSESFAALRLLQARAAQSAPAAGNGAAPAPADGAR